MASQQGLMPSTSSLATAWCNKLQQFCARLQDNCSALHAIVQRKPDPESRDDIFDTFLEDLNEDVSSAMAEIQDLEERTTDTLSAEELLAHCTALYNWNQDGITKLELQLQQYGYTPVAESLKRNKEVLEDQTHEAKVNDFLGAGGADSPRRPTSTLSSISEASIVTPRLSYESRDINKDTEYSPLFGDLGSLEDLGISATSLTALASQDSKGADSIYPVQQNLFEELPSKVDASKDLRGLELDSDLKMKYNSGWTFETAKKQPTLPSCPSAISTSPKTNDENHVGPVVMTRHNNDDPSESVISTPSITVASKEDESVKSGGNGNVAILEKVTKVQFDKFPSWLTVQVSLQELNDSVTIINDVINQRRIGGVHTGLLVLGQEDIKSLGLGSKSKAGLLLLVKANKLVTQSSNGGFLNLTYLDTRMSIMNAEYSSLINICDSAAESLKNDYMHKNTSGCLLT